MNVSTSCISGNMAATKWQVVKNVTALSVNIECCRTKCSKENDQYELTSRITNGDIILEMELNIDELKVLWCRCCAVSKSAITAV